MDTRFFGLNHRGETATLYTFRNEAGMVMEVTDFGATLYALQVPDGKGGKLDVVLGYDTPAGYEGPSGTFFGATIGRNANRIAGGTFALNGKTYHLDINNGPNNLHSGLDFYSFRIWQVKCADENSITFALHSPDGDQGYPGALDVEVTYTLTEDSVRIDYLGLPQGETYINLTNHSYFNLNGHDSGSILNHTLWLDADSFTRANQVSIPTGEILPVEGTPMDFRVPKTVGRDIDMDYEALNFGQGYDHNWCLNTGDTFAKIATLTGDVSGLHMDVYTDLPGVQIYTGNFIDREPGKLGAMYLRRQGICFETQFYPDTPNHPHFPSALFRPGEEYRTRTEFKFY